MSIIVTPGEPSGIGPDVLLSAAQNQWPSQLISIGTAELFEQRAKMLGLPIKIKAFNAHDKNRQHTPGCLEIIELNLPQQASCGTLNVNNASWVVETLRIAAEGCSNGTFSAIATAPVHKGIINDAGIKFSGHTEYFADYAQVEKVVMMLATPNLRVALATTHIPLKEVSDAIDKNLLRDVIRILAAELNTKFAIAEPRILVTGLNPHAGEGGHLGKEEIEVIEPVLAEFNLKARDKNSSFCADIIGPLPADTLFTPNNLKDADAVLAMYHDQGLPVLKSQGFGEAVNITLGLPFIRTSVDHGTALDLAGTGKANSSSMIAAIEMAFQLAANR